MNYIQQTQTQQRTLSTILWNKVLDTIEATTLSALIRNAVLVTCAIIGTFIFSFPDQTADLATAARSTHRVLIVSGIGSFFFFMNLGSIVDWFSNIEFTFTDEMQGSGEATIEGIPVYELLDHLFTEGTFKRAEIESKFGIPRNRFQDLAEQLEHVGVLVRGTNNARVVDETYSRQDLARMLMNCTSHSDIKPIMKHEGGSQYGLGGIGSELKEKVLSLLQHSPSDEIEEKSNMLQTPLE